MKRISKLLSISILSCMMAFCLVFPISAEEIKQNSDIQNDELINEIDWSKVTEIVVLFDDGTNHKMDDEERIKRAELAQSGKIIYENSMYITSRSWTNYFSKVEWINYGGWTYSLSLTPINAFNISKESAWRELRKVWLYDNHPIFKSFNNPGKVDSMYYQFVCHADYARSFKTPWNIEPMRKNVGYWGTVNIGGSLCNPEWYE
ncbi:DUF2599 domain-containing protein [Erysipelothrix rhusiopathiae]|nr:DUF2599 domain-containing protein [Erysipelothrix rhusiopathiae]